MMMTLVRSRESTSLLEDALVIAATALFINFELAGKDIDNKDTKNADINTNLNILPCLAQNL